MSIPIPYETPEATRCDTTKRAVATDWLREALEYRPFMEIITASDLEILGRKWDPRRGTIAEYPVLVNERVNDLHRRGAISIKVTPQHHWGSTLIEYRARQEIV